MSIPTRAEADRMIAEKLAADPAFRDELLADPRAAIGAVFGLEVPESVTITVHEESLTDVHLVIPRATGDELHEEDLDLVAGGACWDNCNCGV